jgi:hypothetical protein
VLKTLEINMTSATALYPQFAVRISAPSYKPAPYPKRRCRSSLHFRFSKSGSSAMLTAMRRASSRINKFAAARRRGSSSK